MNQRLTEVQAFLESHPGYLKRGAANIACKLGCTIEEVKEAKRNIGINTNNNTEYSEYVVDVRNSKKDKKKLKKLKKLAETSNPLYNSIENLIKKWKENDPETPLQEIGRASCRERV